MNATVDPCIDVLIYLAAVREGFGWSELSVRLVRKSKVCFPTTGMVFRNYGMLW